MNEIIAENINPSLEVDVLARTIWGEARGEGSIGMEAVAAVILNRVRMSVARGSYWWGDDVVSICHKKDQFSAWNDNDPNYSKLCSIDCSDVYFAKAVSIAERAVCGKLSDPSNGATHYHVVGIAPYWSVGEKPVAVIGRHIFYKLVGG